MVLPVSVKCNDNDAHSAHKLPKIENSASSTQSFLRLPTLSTLLQFLHIYLSGFLHTQWLLRPSRVDRLPHASVEDTNYSSNNHAEVNSTYFLRKLYPVQIQVLHGDYVS